MYNIDLGTRIKALRRQNGMTQEQLAEKLNVSPQAVSKWENDLAYPDITAIPILATVFDVSIDNLMGYDRVKTAEKVEAIISESGKYFWNAPEKCEAIINDALEYYPDDPRLLRELLSLYECHMRSNQRMEYADKAQSIAFKLIAESDNFLSVCSAKSDLASIYMMQNRYAEAKELIDTLPYMYPYLLNDRMRTSSYLLEGDDRLKEAKDWKLMEQQELFIACSLEGRAFFEIGDYDNALKSFNECKNVIELFMLDDKFSSDSYLISGTHTNHFCCYLGIAACHFKLGRNDECDIAIEKACHIASNASSDNMESYRKYYLEYGLENFKTL